MPKTHSHLHLQCFSRDEIIWNVTAAVTIAWPEGLPEMTSHLNKNGLWRWPISLHIDINASAQTTLPYSADGEPNSLRNLSGTSTLDVGHECQVTVQSVTKYGNSLLHTFCTTHQQPTLWDSKIPLQTLSAICLNSNDHIQKFSNTFFSEITGLSKQQGQKWVLCMKKSHIHTYMIKLFTFSLSVNVSAEALIRTTMQD